MVKRQVRAVCHLCCKQQIYPIFIHNVIYTVLTCMPCSDFQCRSDQSAPVYVCSFGTAYLPSMDGASESWWGAVTQWLQKSSRMGLQQLIGRAHALHAKGPRFSPQENLGEALSVYTVVTSYLMPQIRFVISCVSCHQNTVCSFPLLSLPVCSISLLFQYKFSHPTDVLKIYVLSVDLRLQHCRALWVFQKGLCMPDNHCQRD